MLGKKSPSFLFGHLKLEVLVPLSLLPLIDQSGRDYSLPLSFPRLLRLRIAVEFNREREITCYLLPIITEVKIAWIVLLFFFA